MVSNGPQKVTDPIFVNPPPEGLLNNDGQLDLLVSLGSCDPPPTWKPGQLLADALRIIRDAATALGNQFLDEQMEERDAEIRADLKSTNPDIFRWGGGL